jgi:hypothetical protein
MILVNCVLIDGCPHGGKVLARTCSLTARIGIRISNTTDTSNTTAAAAPSLSA